MAINRAQEEVRRTGDLPVPIPMRNAPTKLMKELGYGEGYKYSHDYPGNFVQQNFFPKEVMMKEFYQAGSSQKEIEIQNVINRLWDKL